MSPDEEFKKQLDQQKDGDDLVEVNAQKGQENTLNQQEKGAVVATVEVQICQVSESNLFQQEEGDEVTVMEAQMCQELKLPDHADKNGKWAMMV